VIRKSQSYALAPASILPGANLAAGYYVMPGGTHFLPYRLLFVGDVAETEMLALLKIRRDPQFDILRTGFIEAVYRSLQNLIIRNHNLQSSARDAPFKKCLIMFRQCSSDTIIRKRRGLSLLK
jgi:hypothetical protein